MHWHEGDSGVCLAYRNENVKVEACLFWELESPFNIDKNPKGVKATVLKTPEPWRKPMKKSSLVTVILRWVKTIAITVSLGLNGETYLQPNVL